MSIYILIVKSLLYILPAYVANSSAALLGGGKPIDRGRRWRGKRILGDGKTVRGFFSGLLLGTTFSVVLSIIKNDFNLLTLGFLLSLGALTGDVAASFFKRRVGLKRGSLAPVLDQIDFVIGAVILVSIVKIPTKETFLVIITMTPLLHLLTNLIGYLCGLKDKPW